MRHLRACLRIVKLVGVLLALAADLFLRPPGTPAGGAERIHRYCKRMVRSLGVNWSVEGECIRSGAVVSNHLSYLDILVFGSIRPFVMVAKAEVRGWPGIGWITRKAGTVYVVRGGDPATYPAVNRAMAEAYGSGLPVLFFPEGTTTDGSEVLGFRRGLFHSVLNEGVSLQAAALSYRCEDPAISIGEDVCWWGDALLAPHLWRLAQADCVRAMVRFGNVVGDREDRFALSYAARQQVAEMYGDLLVGPDGAVADVHEPELVQAL
ncbi:1-acyl-sn-glycerol-3-phosphate acyltransferase [Edaphobacter sp. HDX4]|uniref:lysophospholipid acyltransferase family protein n=1 Tax=Edaphobacter sp. HDX4 TaxID=2794064 RepID=UPI002FE60F72